MTRLNKNPYPFEIRENGAGEEPVQQLLPSLSFAREGGVTGFCRLWKHASPISSNPKCAGQADIAKATRRHAPIKAKIVIAIMQKETAPARGYQISI
jgi:hypothetical protein